MTLNKNDHHHIVLIGFRGTGKSTIGKRLSKMLRWKCISTDALIEKESGMTIGELVRERGWNAFRQIERQIIKRLQNIEQAVIDCGGGVVLDSDNMSLLNLDSLIVWVDADIKQINERLFAEENRPLLNQANLLQDIRTNYYDREPLYRRYGQFYVNTSDDSVEKICKKILDKLERK